MILLKASVGFTYSSGSSCGTLQANSGTDMLWYRLQATGHFGYPQPEVGYESWVYDPNSYCGRCGIGGAQRNPFRFRSEPKARHSKFYQLNWVFDEFFVRP